LNRAQTTATWIAVFLIVVVPVILAAMSPLLEWRNPVYIVAGFSGVIAMGLMLFQPLLAGDLLPGLSVIKARRMHRWVGTALVVSLLVHLVGLWITSPPDVIDALLFVSATPFSIWGVVALWSIFITATLVLFRRKLRLSARVWRLNHRCLALVTVVGSVVHALMIDGTMELFSKIVLCACVAIATGFALLKILRIT